MMQQTQIKQLLRPSLLATCMALVCMGITPQLLAAPAANTLPVLNNLASGSASLSTVGNQLTVSQTSDKLIANWNSFNVGSAAKVQFNQPAINSIALNRISGSASEIFGRVNANGQLILVNPAGITFGSTAQVNAASVIASTLNLSDSNFLADNFLFERVSSGGEINNQGSILANEGNSVLLANSIKNSGRLRARGGNLSLANGNKVTVDNSNGQVTVNQIASVASLIQSTGSLRADRLVASADQGKIFIVADRTRSGSVVELAGQLTSLNNDIQGKTINISGDLTANAATALNAVNAININANFTQNKNSSLLNLNYGSADGLNFGANGKISLSGTGMQYKANNVSYQIIQTLAQLQALDSNTTTRAGKYVLGLDIDASSTASSGFNPIGSSISTPFSGVLDGLGHQIDQLNINKPAKDGVGLFGYALYATIKNLHLSNATIIGKNSVGGLIGYNGNNNGSTGNSWIINSSVSGSLTGYNQLGGLIGSDNVYNLGSSNLIGNSSNSTITGRYSRIGGLTGYANISNGSLNLSGNNSNSIVQASTLADSKYDLGGLIGRLDLSNQASASLSSLHSNGLVSSLSRPAFNVGGVIGAVNSTDATLTLNDVNNHATVSSPHQIVTTTSSTVSAATGGLIGQLALSGTASSLISNSQNHSSIQGLAQVGGLVGALSTANSASIEISNSQNDASIQGLGQLGGLVGWIGTDNTASSEISNSRNNGSMSGTANNIGGLVGQLAVNGTASSLISNSRNDGNIDGTDNLGGLVGRLDAAHTASSVITGASNYGNISGYDNLGGIAGYSNGGLISHSSSSAQSQLSSFLGISLGGIVGYKQAGTISNSHSAMLIGGYSYMGGLVGINNAGDIIDSSSTSSIQSGSIIGGLVGLNYGSISNSHATGLVKTYHIAGGLVGTNTGTISNSYATGDIDSIPTGDVLKRGGLVGENSGLISHSHATGHVIGRRAPSDNASYAGGLVGVNSNSTVEYSYATGNVSGTSGVRGITSLGGLIGQSNNSNVYHSYASGNVSTLLSEMGGREHIGGLIGQVINHSLYITPIDINVNINNNYASGNVSGTTNQTGTTNVGGLIGSLEMRRYNSNSEVAVLSNNYATGSVSKSSGISGAASNFGGLIGGVTVANGTFILDNSYASGAINAGDASNVGAFIGKINVDAGTTTSMNNNYWNSTVAGNTAIGNANLIQPPVNLTGLSATQMTQQSSFVGWDISSQLNGSNSIWYINNGVSAPVLRSFLSP